MITKVWIVLVDYNGLEDTRRCLQSLETQTESAQIVLVDNASRIEVAPELAAEFPSVHFVRSAVNGGWAGGNNLGMKYAVERDAELIILLNNDTTVSPDLVSRIRQAAEAHPQFGIFGPVIRFMDPPCEIQTDGVVFNRPGKPGFFQRRVVPLHTTQPPQLEEVDIVNGCCMAIRRDVIHRIGWIDEAFFLIHEESDFCLRSLKAGFKNGILAESLIWHKGSSTFRREGKRYQRYYDSRNLVRLIQKHGRLQQTRGLFQSYLHHFRYAYHRYAIEREEGFTDSANAVVEGLYDAFRGHYGPYAPSSRLGSGLLRNLFAVIWRIMGDKVPQET